MGHLTIDQSTWISISQTIADHVWLIDNNMADRAIDLFAEGARLEFAKGAPVPAVYDGKKSVEGFLKARAAQRDGVSRHIVTNVRMIRQEDGSVLATSLVTLYRGNAGERSTTAAVIADVTETYVLEPDQVWRIMERVVMPVLLANAT
ncbi:nuclear transport factor 2 family protein [Cupriavidus basilensis]|uniref:nuclear transport factor 2 family protein n=1 Tax=Cupriavidus basilensis TaxID=68895 RepID=UPI0005B99F7B|nr:nuclear transport factor 2 family protein [Cupriavidus basilensis]